MSNMFASRKIPLMVAAGVFTGLLYTTYGAKQQPRPLATHDASSQAPVSETIQRAAGTGGARARTPDEVHALRESEYDPRDTRLHSSDPSAASKRNPAKVRGDLGGDETTVGGGGQGKHIGEREEGKAGDLPWKKIGGS
ncbi:hypothetical protein C8A01DRAFT_15007 [Parachaetomium inaequale]|uniref:Uncharacterized protein n=1 Tax=Parachaetomium inaequale TaxID=2588326 RepID=A0AAN6PJI4_9PEZI|nr:hypothetical protein C8A01DRAFT_15007 [Parachaetomium inaequale]